MIFQFPPKRRQKKRRLVTKRHLVTSFIAVWVKKMGEVRTDKDF